MQSLIEDRTEELVILARRHGVSRLDVFGSAATGEFDEAHSDLDFVVAFVEQPPEGVANAYFGLLEDLQQLFGRQVDLVTERSIRNPYFRESVEETRRPVYVA
ncbi:MAG: nucleotidyltransferase domain-containing protein [Nitrosospira sp.]|nr:nucleotidyltransferase domain-containing protein [Nitrosospira sp.]